MMVYKIWIFIGDIYKRKCKLYKKINEKEINKNKVSR